VRKLDGEKFRRNRGTADNGKAIVVETDESKYFHRKYHREQWREGHSAGWSGGWENVFLWKFRIAPLQQHIQDYILPGRHIVSDGSLAYANIDAIRDEIYTHSVIIHQTDFMDLNDSEIHTQNIENMWMRAKRKIKRQFGTSRELFPSYLHEFVFRNGRRGRDIFSHFMVCVAESYVCIQTENHTQQELQLSKTPFTGLS